MTFVHRLRLKRGKTRSKRVVRSWLSKCGSIVALILVRPIRCVLLLMYQHSQALRDVLTIALQIRHRVLSWALSRNRQVRPVCVHAVTRCTLLASFLYPLSLSPVTVHSSCQVLNSSTVPRVSLSFAPVSMFTTNSDICLFLFSVLHIRRRLD